jgi:hypothetical protein
MINEETSVTVDYIRDNIDELLSLAKEKFDRIYGTDAHSREPIAFTQFVHALISFRTDMLIDFLGSNIDDLRKAFFLANEIDSDDLNSID